MDWFGRGYVGQGRVMLGVVVCVCVGGGGGVKVGENMYDYYPVLTAVKSFQFIAVYIPINLQQCELPYLP